MDARTVIAKVRDGTDPTADELAWFAGGLANGVVSDAQAGAFAMAVLQRGLSDEGRTALTRAMRDSGDTMKWDLPGPVVDKHSTGGIGDTVSLLLAPMLAAEGLYVPMISGRGLGHTGGTLDKLEAIPGVSTVVSEDRFREIVSDIGCAIVSATGELAPADRRLYAVRDVTATVESVELITSSILSKKLAAGLEALVLDVKVGSGAFLPSLEAAAELAEALVRTANAAGCKTAALLTDMNQPLAPASGNALEIQIVCEVLGGSKSYDRLMSVSSALAAKVAGLAGVERTAEEFERVVAEGRAAVVFSRLVAALGGPSDIVDKSKAVLPTAAAKRPVVSGRSGYVCAIDGRRLGQISVQLGAGRQTEGDAIEPSVGLSDLVPIGSPVDVNDPIGFVHAADEAAADMAAGAVGSAYEICAEPPETSDLILAEIT